MHLNWRLRYCAYQLESLEMNCDELSIKAMIDKKALHDFKIGYQKGDIIRKYCVYAH